jgi:transketolase
MEWKAQNSMVRFSTSQLQESWRKSQNLSELSNLLRVNTLDLVQEAGSGHIGSSFSVMDILIAVHRFEQQATFPKQPDGPYRVFSSKGHDAPAFYAVNHLLGLIPESDMKLRRLGYLPGHPEIGSGGTVTNTGSLGMGISKARGFAAGDFIDNRETTTYVILGDGELQEGQIWESLNDSSKVLGKVVALVDGNSIQSDTWVSKTRDLGDVRAKVEASGWLYLETDGHDFDQIAVTLEEAKKSTRPAFIWAHTQKGKGSLLLTNFPDDGKFYHHHSGALSKDIAAKVCEELLGESVNFEESGLDFGGSPKMLSETMPNLWATILEETSRDREDVVVLDGDLALDTGTYSVVGQIGARYMQMGIAEQDMVSTAGGLALAGKTPIVHSFATFLTMRPFEQIVNNASEGTRIIYLGFLAGIVPSAAGFSHQAVIDLSIMSAIPGMSVFEPATEQELRACLKTSLELEGPSYLRMNSVAVPTNEGEFVADPEFLGTQYGTGEDFLILCSGAFSLGQSLSALEILKRSGRAGQVRTLANKKINRDHSATLSQHLTCPVLLVENGAWYHGTFSNLEAEFRESGKIYSRVAIEGFPVNGQPDEVARYHKMDADSITSLVLELLSDNR